MAGWSLATRVGACGAALAEEYPRRDGITGFGGGLLCGSLSTDTDVRLALSFRTVMAQYSQRRLRRSSGHIHHLTSERGHLPMPPYAFPCTDVSAFSSKAPDNRKAISEGELSQSLRTGKLWVHTLRTCELVVPGKPCPAKEPLAELLAKPPDRPTLHAAAWAGREGSEDGHCMKLPANMLNHWKDFSIQY